MEAGLPESTEPQGLSSAEAARLLEQYGPNELVEERRSVVRELLSHFSGPIPWMIEAALALTAAVERWADFAIILVLLLVNGLVGFWEEHQAGSAIAALKERLATQARVRRDGRWQTVDARELVPGDLVHVELGQVVPADAELVHGSLEVDQSVLTGESLPVEKTGADTLLSGTVVTLGEATAAVTVTGPRTSFGRTAELAGAEPPQSHFQRAVLAIGRYLILLAVVLVAVIVLDSLLQGQGVTETLEFALVVLIASVPVALPAVLSVTMAVGARRLAHHQAVVSHLPVVEEMAGVDVLCADKTGTITENRLTVGQPLGLNGSTGDDVLVGAALSSQAEGRDPIDRAILEALPGAEREGYEQVEFRPFDPVRKRSEAKVRAADGQMFDVAKGAVQAIASLVGDGPGGQELEAAASQLAARGFRSLAVARREDERWMLVGVLPLHDPPRADSRTTIEQARALGLDVKMVTGDREEIAREVAREVDLGETILPADALGADPDMAQLANRVQAADGFAQVVPEHKYRIVEALQEQGHIVGMTGDGVNDAPALRRADAGIAVAGATDAARAAADIVLLAPGLSVIVEAIRLAREAFARMTNYAIYRVTETIRVVVFVSVAILGLGFFPVTAVMIVLLALLNDAAILTIAFDNVRPSERAERWRMREVLAIATVLGLVGVVESFVLLELGLHPLDLDRETLRTLLYLKLSVAGHLTVFVARTRGPFWSVPPAPVLLVAVLGTQIIATLIAVYGFLMEPLGWPLAALAWGYALVWFLLLDATKLAAYRALDRRGGAGAAEAAA